MRVPACGLRNRGGASIFRSPMLYPAELRAHAWVDADPSISSTDCRAPRPDSPTRPDLRDNPSDFYSAAFLTPPQFPPLAQLRPHERRSAVPRPSYWGRAAMSDRRPTPPYSTRAGGSIHPSPARPWRHGHPWRGGAVRITGGYPDGSLGSGRRGNLGRGAA